MYQVDRRDKVLELENVPQSSVGAPMPVVLSDEGKVVLAYYIQDTPEDWDGSSVRIVDEASNEPVAILEIKICYHYMFGWPNDEAFSGHPLAKRGLTPYGAFEVQDSSWIRQLERLNSVHPYHKPERYWRSHHYVFSFHDSTFECVADGFNITESRGSLTSILPLMAEKLWKR